MLRSLLHRILAHPLTQLGVGLVMVGTGLSELVEAFDGTLAASSAHGVLVYGVIHAGKALLELLEGLEKVDAEQEATEPGSADGASAHPSPPAA